MAGRRKTSRAPSVNSSGLSPHRVLAALMAVERDQTGAGPHARPISAADLSELLSRDLVERDAAGRLVLTAAGRAYRARAAAEHADAPVGKFRAQHLALSAATIATDDGEQVVMTDHAESPLVWLARRKGHDGKAHIEPVHLQAGERLRSDFTAAQFMPRTTSNWSGAIGQGSRGIAPTTFSDMVIAARQRVRRALDAVGPEFAGLLVDVCCFLKRLEDVERERRWPPRSAKVVLQLGLDRLARHFGLGGAARGQSNGTVRTWLAPDVCFTVDGDEPSG
jgi:hypothetical protein